MAASKRAGANAFVVLEMAWSAAYVDAACYLELRRLYTAHMSGNTASLAIRAVQGNTGDILRYACALASFVFGLLLSAAMTQFERRRGFRAAFSVVLAIEFLLLLSFGMWAAAPQPVAIFCAAAAMGMQTVTVTRVGTLRVYTTYITGTLSKFAESVVCYAFWLRARTRGRLLRRGGRALLVSPRQRSFQHAAITGALWLAYLSGAVCGALACGRWRRLSLAAPLALLLATIAVDIARPVALGDQGGEEAR